MSDLDPEKIRAALGDCPIGSNLVFVDAVDSTNDLAAQLATGGSAHGTLVVARRQTAGRGRRRRQWWHDADCGIAMSVVLRPTLPASRAPELVHVAALVVDDTVHHSGIASRIKWPNDIVAELDGGWRKIAGILVESSLRGSEIEHAVVGIGINVNTPANAFAADAGPLASSLAVASGTVHDRTALVCAICRALVDRFERWQRDGFEPLRGELVRRSATIGHPVQITIDGRPVAGRAIGIAADGALVVEDERGQRLEVREPLDDRS